MNDLPLINFNPSLKSESSSENSSVFKNKEKRLTIEEMKALGSNTDEIFSRVTNPEDAFAACFYVYFPRLEMLVSKLSNRKLRRLIRAIIETPLNKKQYNMFTTEEKEAFVLADKLLESKFLMIIHTQLEYMKELEAHKDLEAKELEARKDSQTSIGTSGEVSKSVVDNNLNGSRSSESKGD